MAAPRKPTKLLQLKGTLDKSPSRKSQAHRMDDKLPMLDPGTEILPPPGLVTEEAQTLWSGMTHRFLQWGILSDVDLVELERALWLHQQLRSVQDELASVQLTDDRYGQLMNITLKMSKEISRLLAGFGVTPTERSKLTLAASEIKKNESVLDRVKKKK